MNKFLRYSFVALMAMVFGNLMAEETIDFTAQGYANAAEVAGYQGTDIEITFAGNGASNNPKWYNTGTAIRVYAKNSMTIASSKTIIGIKFTLGSDGPINENNEGFSTGTYDREKMLWTGSTSELKLTNVAKSGNQIRLQKMVFYFEGETIPSGGDTPDPAINASNVTIESEATSGEIAYTISNPTTASLTAAVKEGDWISNVQVDAGNKKVTFSVTQNTGAQRIGKITLSYEGATSKDVQITQKASYGTATLPFAFDGGKSDIATTAGLSPNNLGSDYSSSPKLKFDGEGDYLILKIEGAAEVLNFDIKGNGTNTEPWAGTFKVQTSADGVTYTDLKTYTELTLTSDVLHVSIDNVPSSARYIKWIYITKTMGNVGIGRIGVNCEAVYIPNAGYATYTTPNNVDFAGTGVTAYKVSAIGADYVSLEEVTEAPAGTPLVLKATAGNYALNIVASAAAVTGNKLEVSDGTATTDDANTVYALAAKGEPAVVGFYKVKAGVKVPAGKCYLSVAVTSAREFLGFGDDATSIYAVQDSGLKVNGEVYDLSGRRIQKPTKGLYIQNGKKVVIK
jgi:hypothetical protein